MNKRIRGFTLIEILIAMSIMGILAGIGFSSYTISIKKSRDAGRKADLSQIQTALEAYISDFGVYPASCSEVLSGCGDGTDLCSWGGGFVLDSGKVYMKKLPREIKSDWNYVYLTDSTGRQYQIYAQLENDQDSAYLEYSVSCGDATTNCTYGVSSSNATLVTPLVPGSC